jgi:5-methyltetrahydropteroyltriglutamate--homocysteine methyltransferase
MKRSVDRILTTHVGSLIRPQPLQEFLRAKQASKPFDLQAYDHCLTDRSPMSSAGRPKPASM